MNLEVALKATKLLIATTLKESDVYRGHLMDAAVDWAIEEYYH